MELILFFAGLALGGVIGWVTNYWFVVILPRPKLEVAGSNSFAPAGYTSFSLSISNERRHLGIRSPLPFIWYKFGKPHIGGRTISRKVAEQCMATLHDTDGHQICNLWWDRTNNEVKDVVNIECGREKQANIRLFMRNNDENAYFVYQPVSQQDPAFKTSGIPRFTGAKEFVVRIFYEYGEQKMELPIKVADNYDGSFTLIAPGSSSQL